MSLRCMCVLLSRPTCGYVHAHACICVFICASVCMYQVGQQTVHWVENRLATALSGVRKRLASVYKLSPRYSLSESRKMKSTPLYSSYSFIIIRTTLWCRPLRKQRGKDNSVWINWSNAQDLGPPSPHNHMCYITSVLMVCSYVLVHVVLILWYMFLCLFLFRLPLFSLVPFQIYFFSPNWRCAINIFGFPENVQCRCRCPCRGSPGPGWLKLVWWKSFWRSGSWDPCRLSPLSGPLLSFTASRGGLWTAPSHVSHLWTWVMSHLCICDHYTFSTVYTWCHFYEGIIASTKIAWR